MGIKKDSKSTTKGHESCQVLTFEERLNILHLHEQHQFSIGKICRTLGMKYSSVRAIVQTFKSSGRINKLLTLSAKQVLLKDRQERLQNSKKNGNEARKCGLGLYLGISAYDLETDDSDI